MFVSNRLILRFVSTLGALMGSDFIELDDDRFIELDDDRILTFGKPRGNV